jgi:carbon storage regulator CsrA
MLILKRNVSELVDVYCYDSTGKEISISLMVVEIGPTYVRIGIEAPKDVLILRREVPKKEKS